MVDIFGYKNIELVVFDKDGTLTDVHSFWAEITLRRCKALVDYCHLSNDHKVIADIAFAMGLDVGKMRLLENGPVGVVSRNEVIVAVKKFLHSQYKVDISIEEISQIFDVVHQNFVPDMPKYIKLLPNVKKLLESLLGKCKLAIITSDGRDSVNFVAEYTGIKQYFDYIIAREDCIASKSTGQPLINLLETTQIKPEKTLVIGDAQMDYQMASRATVKNVVLVATGQSSVETLQKNNCVVIDSFNVINRIYL